MNNSRMIASTARRPRQLTGRPSGLAMALVIATVGFTAACGTRVSQSQVGAPLGASPTAQARSVTASDEAGATVDVVGQPSPATAQPVTARPGTEPRSAATNPGQRPQAATGDSPAKTPASVPAKPAPTGGNPEPSSASPAVGGRQAPVAPAGGTPIVAASVGTYSGPIGSTLFPMVQGAQVWVTQINRRGGLNGHQVKLIVYDDGNDPARHTAQIREAIEQRHVVAFLQNSGVFTGGPSAEYIKTKHVPVIGVSTGETWALSNPMFFPQAPTAQNLLDTWPPAAAAQWIPAGKVKLATLMCAEGQVCADAEKTFVRDAAGVGFDYVHRGRISVAQPDFTAECLAMRNAGVQALYLGIDSNTIARVANSCARQGFRPAIGFPIQSSADSYKDDPNFDGAIGVGATFPYFQSGTPGTDEFREAMRAAGVALGGGAALGWTAGKLFERAGSHVTEPPTSESLLGGLYSIQNETLGGLTGPLTFVEAKPLRQQRCWFTSSVGKGKWITPNGFKLQCL